MGRGVGGRQQRTDTAQRRVAAGRARRPADAGPRAERPAAQAAGLPWRLVRAGEGTNPWLVLPDPEGRGHWLLRDDAGLRVTPAGCSCGGIGCAHQVLLAACSASPDGLPAAAPWSADLLFDEVRFYHGAAEHPVAVYHRQLGTPKVSLALPGRSDAEIATLGLGPLRQLSYHLFSWDRERQADNETPCAAGAETCVHGAVRRRAAQLGRLQTPSPHGPVADLRSAWIRWQPAGLPLRQATPDPPLVLETLGGNALWCGTVVQLTDGRWGWVWVADVGRHRGRHRREQRAGVAPTRTDAQARLDEVAAVYRKRRYHPVP